MLNVRWTPLDMERALRPSDFGGGRSAGGRIKQRRHATIILHGPGYEGAAAEAVVRGGGGSGSVRHVAVVRAIPSFACEAVGRGVPSCGKEGDVSSRDEDLREGEKCHDSEKYCGDADAVVLFTSGTSSGTPKGVRLSHRSLLVQAYAKTFPPCGYNSDTAIAATTVPWFHVGGISSALAAMLVGGRFVFPPNDAFDAGAATVRKTTGFRPEVVLRSLTTTLAAEASSRQVYVANTLVVVPAMLHAMLELVEGSLFSNVRLILVGGQSIGGATSDLLGRVQRAFPNARVVQTYACTEAGSSVTFDDLGVRKVCGGDSGGVGDHGGDASVEVVGECVGLPPSHVQLGIFAPPTSAPQVQPTPRPPGEVGVVGTRGPHVMSGYWTRGERGKDNSTFPRLGVGISPGGWMLTSDLGYIHPATGKLHFCGRANDVIRTGGETVWASEVEKALITHESVAECAVVSLPDDRFGEAVCAAVVVVAKPPPSSHPSLSSSAQEDQGWRDELRRHCAERQLAGYKQPRRVFVVRALPRNSSGKVLKHELTKAFLEGKNKTARSDKPFRSRL